MCSLQEKFVRLGHWYICGDIIHIKGCKTETVHHRVFVSLAILEHFYKCC